MTVTREKAAGPTALAPIDTRRGWFSVAREPFAGAWQRGVEVRVESVLTFSAVYACMTLIASDIAKMRMRLVQQDGDGIWNETTTPAFSPVLTKPNHFQNRIEFFEHWVISKLVSGNTYVLKERDNRNVVVGLYVLDPRRVKPLVAPNGDVYYQLSRDDLSGLPENQITVPASEIIHDRMNALYHPLVGISPIHACGLAATQGLRIQANSAKFFENNSNPGGILTAPSTIDQATADRLKRDFTENYSGENAGKIAVAGDGLKFEQLTITASDSQLIEQLKWTAETVCSCFKVPAYKVGVGAAPLNNNVEALDQQYYSQCLQILIEKIELCLDEGLALPGSYGTEFDLDDLLRMDTATQVKTYSDAVKGGLLKPNEGRKKLNQPPVAGGDAVYLQQQNYSIEALAKRDGSDDPFATSKPTPPPAQTPPPEPQADAAAKEAAGLIARFAVALREKTLRETVDA
ncbi:phage portal protein [Sphingomonas nostoxanthinifaciens]|nr:phage portal protein [Sphingomonas nostoxanthinifaciens]